MGAIDIINNVLPKENTFQKTKYLLNSYKDLKYGALINPEYREVLSILEVAIDQIKGEEDFDIIDLEYIQGIKVEEVASAKNMDMRTLYRRRKRLIKRMAIVIYGDKAL